jgi:hypothetical protein
MALNRLFACLIAVTLTAGTLPGCDGGGGDSPPAASDDAPKPKRHRKPKQAPTQTATATGAAAAPGAPAASSPAAPALKPRAFLYRNVSYDKMRTRAMQMVYEGKTKKALNAFQDVQRSRPADPAVQMWVAAIRASAQKARDSAPTAVDDFKTAAQQLRTPTQPAVGGAPATTTGTAAGTPATGAAPTLPRPALPASNNTGSTTTVDPRLVF